MLTNRVDEYAGYPGLKPGQAWPSVAKPSPLFVFGGFRERERFQKSALFKHEAYRLLSVVDRRELSPLSSGVPRFLSLCFSLCVISRGSERLVRRFTVIEWCRGREGDGE